MKETIDIRKIRGASVQKSGKRVKLPGFSFLSFLDREISFGHLGINDKVKEAFYLELWSLLDAGVDLTSALTLIIEGIRKKSTKVFFKEIKESVISGCSLSMALKNTDKFSKYDYYSIQIGEETGKLSVVLKDLASYYTKKIKQKRLLISAFTYPAVVLIIAVAAVSFMVAFVVPMFSETFKRFGSDLPSLTKTVISVSENIRAYSKPFFLLLMVLVVLSIWQSKRDWYRRIFSWALLKVPIAGKILHSIYLSRFANTFSLLIGAKIPIVQAIQLIKQMISFYPIEITLSKIEEDILNGKSLHKSLSASSIYPSKMIALVKVGEEVNQLELFFARLSEQYASDAEYQTNLLSKFLEPVIIVLLGLIVGIILIAMYLPMFKLGQQF